MWQVPVVVNAGSQSKRLILGREPMHIEFPGCEPVVANGGDTGYYRVQYDPANMARLRAAYPQLPATERIGLVADTMALASCGRSGVAAYFRVLDAIRVERAGTVWQAVLEGLTDRDGGWAGRGAPTERLVKPAVDSAMASILSGERWSGGGEPPAGRPLK